MCILLAAQEDDWDILEKIIIRLQSVNMKMKYLTRPVVAAPAGMALSGRCKESMVRATEGIPTGAWVVIS
jgi:3-hydroxyacyl-CoA dehydrogenase